jgi:hypothetical protein
MEDCMDKETHDELVALAKRVDGIEQPTVQQVVCTAPFAVTYTVDGVSRRYEAQTVYDILTLIERTRTQEMEFDERENGK